ncbi:MAG: SGNH/GDSL hydrolase family protein [Planctomycetota bacterium]|jgi:lysophospholipase L1-like esterase
MPQTARLAAVVIAIQLALVAGIAYGYAALRNSLDRNGNWISGKLLCEDPGMGAHQYMASPRSLARARVDLGRWHGHQELLYREPLAVQHVSFEFRLGSSEYGIFLFNGTDDRISGLRLGQSARFPSVYFTAHRGGEFLSTQPLDTGPWQGDRWSRMDVRFCENGFVARLDGHEFANVDVPIAKPQIVGFHGCARRILVDDIRIRHATGVVEESFFNGADFGRALLAGVIAFAVLDGILFFFLRRRGATSKEFLFRAVTVGLVAAICLGAILFIWDRRLSQTYLGYITITDPEFRNDVVRDRTREIRRQHAEQPAPDVTRILFIGSSQTWGEGARHRSEAFIPILRRRLGPGFECINAGLRALRATRLAQLYEDDWSRLSPHLVIVNLSNNDHDPDALGAALERMIRTSRRIGAKVLFVKEPNSAEHQSKALRKKHDVMASVAQRHGVRVLDLNAYMGQQFGRGLLWWDQVHPTSFGHRLMAERILPEIKAMVDE